MQQKNMKFHSTSFFSAVPCRNKNIIILFYNNNNTSISLMQNKLSSVALSAVQTNMSLVSRQVCKEMDAE